MRKFSGMLNSHGGWKGYVQYCKMLKVEYLQKWQSRNWFHSKYSRYSKTQPDLYHEKGKAYNGSRSWNVGKPNRPGRRQITLMSWRSR